jgi:hypothetical protein
MSGLLPTAPRYAAIKPGKPQRSAGIAPESGRHVRSLMQQQRESNLHAQQGVEMTAMPASPRGSGSSSPLSQSPQSSSQRRLSVRTSSHRRLAASANSSSHADIDAHTGSVSRPSRPLALPRLQMDAATDQCGDLLGTGAGGNSTSGAPSAMLSLSSPAGLIGAPSAAARRRDRRDTRHRIGPSSLHLNARAVLEDDAASKAAVASAFHF